MNVANLNLHLEMLASDVDACNDPENVTNMLNALLAVAGWTETTSEASAAYTVGQMITRELGVGDE